MALIHIEDLSKHFKILNRREGLRGAFRDLFSGALIPLQFFPDAIRNILLCLPFQAIYHTPLMMVTKPDQGWEVFLPMLVVQLLWVIVLFVGTQLFYNQAIKVLRIGGG